MNIKPNYRNAKYINAKGNIDCEIEHPNYGWIPYTLDLQDTGSGVDNTYLLSIITDAKAYEPPTQEEIDAELALDIRMERQGILVTIVDPFVSNPLRWESLTEKEKDSIKTYRQELLDITEQEGFPSDVTWPTKPEVLN